MNNQKGFAPVIIVLIVVVLIAGGFLAWQYFGAPEEAEVPEEAVEDQIEPKIISEEEAIDLVKNLPEVKEWLALFTGPGGTGPTTGGRPIIVVDSKSEEGYTIHVYEQLSDHTATFNWYSVNLKTGEIIPMF